MTEVPAKAELISSDVLLYRGLPNELILQILGNCLVLPYSINEVNQQSYAPRTDLVSLQLVSKQMRDLIVDVYHGENTFVVSRPFRIMSEENYNRPMCYPPFKLGHFVRNLELRLDFLVIRDLVLPKELVRASHCQFYRDHRLDWMILLRPLEPMLDSPKPTDHPLALWFWLPKHPGSSWQQHFPKLKKLKIVLTGYYHRHQRPLDMNNMKPVIEQLAQYTAIDIRPLEVEVEVPPTPILTSFFSFCPWDDEIRDLVKKTIEGMIHLRKWDDDKEVKQA